MAPRGGSRPSRRDGGRRYTCGGAVVRLEARRRSAQHGGGMRVEVGIVEVVEDAPARSRRRRTAGVRCARAAWRVSVGVEGVEERRSKGDEAGVPRRGGVEVVAPMAREGSARRGVCGDETARSRFPESCRRTASGSTSGGAVTRPQEAGSGSCGLGEMLLAPRAEPEAAGRQRTEVRGLLASPDPCRRWSTKAGRSGHGRDRGEVTQQHMLRRRRVGQRSHERRRAAHVPPAG